MTLLKDKRLVILLLLLAVLPLLDLITSVQIAALLPPVLIYCLIALGLTVATGFTGLLHLGVAAFVAIGAYTFAILTCTIYPFQLSWPLAVLLSGVVGWLVGYSLGLPIMRLRGDYLAIVTLGFGEIVQDLLRNLDVITKGTQGINPLPGPSFSLYLTASPDPASTATSPYLWYYLLLALIICTAFTLQHLLTTQIGRSWLAVRDDELAASCIGISGAKTKLSTLALSSSLCAVGGACMASYLGSSGEPSTYDFQVSILVLCSLIVGGLGSIPGAIFGALLMVGLNSVALPLASEKIALLDPELSGNVFFNPGNWKYMLFGLVLVLMMRFRPEGFLPPIPKGGKT